MYSSLQDVRWWATRYKFSKTWKKQMPNKSLNDLMVANYAYLLMAVFSHLYNVRQQKGSYHGY